ncbi:MAG: MBL fold metallo-hydrolase [Actinomycetaceae bacterium]|nr:MBL fold metallo-hydrolase [Actinomycetaceae bacterium]
MKLTIIGCSGSMSGKDSPASAYLVQARGVDRKGLSRTFSLILDFGPGAMGHLLRYADPAMVDAMILSHLHADHCVDIVGMQVFRRWYPEGALPRIPVFSPGDGIDRTRKIADDSLDEDYAGEFDFQRVGPGDKVTLGPFTIEFFEAWHTIESLSVRITGPSEDPHKGDVVLCYTGDTDYTPTVVQAAKGADVLLSEAAFEEKRDMAEGIHLTGKRAGQLAADAGAKRLLLTHLQPWTNPNTNVNDARSVYHGPVECVEAGNVYEF